MRTNGQPQANRKQATQHDDDGVVIEGEFMEGKMMTQKPSASLVRAQTDYVTAAIVQKPRELKALLARAVEEAELAADDFEYYWTVRNKDGKEEPIEGISIEGAMIMMRHYGNCACPVDIVTDAPEHWVLRATFIDLETGISYERLFRQRKSQRIGKMDADRALDIAFQIGQSKAQRNAIEKAMPVWLKTACVEASRKAAAAKIKDLPRACADTVAKFAKASKDRITQAMLEAKAGKAIELWSARDVVRLGALYKALVERQTTIEAEWPKPEEDVGGATPPAASTDAGSQKPEGERGEAQPNTDAPASDASAPGSAATTSSDVIPEG